MNRKMALRGALLTLLGGVLWGFSGTCGQYLLQVKGLTSEYIVPVRLLCGGTLLLLLGVMKQGKGVFDAVRNDAPGILVFSILGMAMCQYTYYSAIDASNAGTATVLEYLSPVLIMLYVSLASRQRPTVRKLIVLALALGGTVILATHGNLGTLAISTEALIWGLASAVTFALNSLLPGKLMDEYGTLPIVGWGMLIGGCVTSIPYRVWAPVGVFDLSTFLGLAGIIVVGTLLSYTWYMEGVRRIGPEKANLYACIEPLSATLFAVLWLKSDIQPVDLLGFACILSAVTLLSFSKKKA